MDEINNRDFIKADTLKTYRDIDINKVLTDYLLDKYPKGIKKHKDSEGNDIYTVSVSDIVDMTLIYYRLSHNTTNKKNVTYQIEKYCRRNFILIDERLISIPAEIIQNKSVQETITMMANIRAT